MVRTSMSSALWRWQHREKEMIPLVHQDMDSSSYSSDRLTQKRDWRLEGRVNATIPSPPQLLVILTTRTCETNCTLVLVCFQYREVKGSASERSCGGFHRSVLKAATVIPLHETRPAPYPNTTNAKQSKVLEAFLSYE